MTLICVSRERILTRGTMFGRAYRKRGAMMDMRTDGKQDTHIHTGPFIGAQDVS